MLKREGCDDIIAAFEPCYTTTLFSKLVTSSAVYDLETKLEGYTILKPMD